MKEYQRFFNDFSSVKKFIKNNFPKADMIKNKSGVQWIDNDKNITINAENIYEDDYVALIFCPK